MTTSLLSELPEWEAFLDYVVSVQDPLVAARITVLADTMTNQQVRCQFKHDKLLLVKEEAKDAKRYVPGETPPSIEVFLDDPQYMGPRDGGAPLWPKVREAVIEVCTGPYHEAVLTGGIGTAKTTVALYALAFKLYDLLCLRFPHKELGMDPASEITFVFQSVTGGRAKEIDYERFRAMIEGSSKFAHHFPHDRLITGQLRFVGRRIAVKPISSTSTGALGENVMGGAIDEINFMDVIQHSSRNIDGGVYDQAVDNYQAIARRRESRFLKQGYLPGLLCLVSSRRYPGQFTDVKEEQARKPNSGIYVYDPKIWEVKPDGTYRDKWFKVFLGDATRTPRILTDEEVEAWPEEDKALVMEIPDDLRKPFEEDIYGALRDIAGVATYARHPFLHDKEIVAAAFHDNIKPILSRQWCDFDKTKIIIEPKNFINLEWPRMAHIDLATTGDSAGVACGYVPKFMEVSRGEGVSETLPIVCFDFLLEVRPPRSGEIIFAKIRALLLKLRDMGMPIKWVTADSFQSTDSLQILSAEGFITGITSVDRTTAPYDMLKAGIADGRVVAPSHAKAQMELVSLERDQKTNKIDHPPHGSKDVADGMAGVAWGLTRRLEIWAMHGVPPIKIPPSIKAAQAKHAEALKDGGDDG